MGGNHPTDGRRAWFYEAAIVRHAQALDLQLPHGEEAVVGRVTEIDHSGAGMARLSVIMRRVRLLWVMVKSTAPRGNKCGNG